jgi:hypothetical protein
LASVKGNFIIHDGREYFLSFFEDKPGEPVKNALFCTQKGNSTSTPFHL